MTHQGRSLASALALTLLVGCAATEPDAPPRTTPNYAVAGVVYGDDTATSYVSLLPSLDIDRIDYDQALELPGAVTLSGYGGWLFVGDREARTITRYSVADGVFVKDGVLSFGNYEVGDLSVDDWGNTFINAKKAYLVTASGAVVWDPTALAISGEIQTPELLRDPTLQLNSSPGFVRGNRLYRTYSWMNQDEFETLPEQYLAVFDVDNDLLLDLVPEERCPMLTSSVTADEAGNAYFSSWFSMVPQTLLRGAPKSCALRLNAGTDEFDPDWKLDFSEFTGGREGSSLVYLKDGQGLVSVFHDERVAIDDGTDILDLDDSQDWQFWKVDFESSTATPVEGLDWLYSRTFVSKNDGRAFVLLPSADFTSTVVYELGSSGPAERRFEIKGFSYHLATLH